VRKGSSKKDGQTWAERWDTKGFTKEFLFVILGQSQGKYRLLCLEDGSEDEVARRAIDKPGKSWRRVT
jgi:hypothetical protein